MKKIIIDTNLWISFAIGKRTVLLRQVLEHPDVSVYVCDELLAEINNVLERPKLSKYIKQEDKELLHRLINTYCHHITITHTSELPIRDVKDLYLLSFAETIPADIIISGDADLLVLDGTCPFKIMTLTTFMESLSHTIQN